MTDQGFIARTAQLDGLVNARDLGGLRRADGTRTPSGVLFRSENVGRLSPRGWDELAALGVRTVVDLRQPWERERDTSPRPTWVSTVAIDLDGLADHPGFWTDYWDNGLVGTALYYAPHLRALPERSVEALTAIVMAPPGGVLFHCMGGRDRTGLVAMLLLVAADVLFDDIVEDYLETVRGGDLCAASSNRNDEAQLEALCRSRGTTTEGAFRSSLHALDLGSVLDAGGMTVAARSALASWRGMLTSPYAAEMLRHGPEEQV